MSRSHWPMSHWPMSGIAADPVLQALRFRWLALMPAVGFRWLALIPALLCLLSAGPALAQGFILPIRPIPLPRPFPIVAPPERPRVEYSIKELLIEGQVTGQLAQIQITQVFENKSSSPIEGQFVFPLPYDGAIDSLTLMANGKEIPAKLLSKEEARKRYEAIVRASKDPALLEWVGQGMFQTSVFPIPAQSTMQVVITYKQLLRKSQSLTELIYPLATARFTSKPLEKLSLRIVINSEDEIRNVYSPTHPVVIERPAPKQAIIKLEQTGTVPTSDLRLFYDTQAGPIGTSLLTYRPSTDEEGYFLLLTTPQLPVSNAPPVSKSVVFVVDRSGSMSGEKFTQARNAMKTMLNQLRPGDTFNIVAYAATVESFKPELEAFNDTTRQEAINYVEGLHAGGGTNIRDALTTALKPLTDPKRPAYVLFLTDGLPTVVETNELKIAEAVKQANTAHARLLCLGVGYDVNSRLLDRMARSNSGTSEYVRPNEDIEVAVGQISQRIQSPVMTNAKITYLFDGPWSGPEPISRVMPTGNYDLFAGEQLTITGRYRQNGKATVVLEGQVNGEPVTIRTPVEFVEKSTDQTLSFVQTVWALRRIGELIDEIDLHGNNAELVKELVDLSTRHGILTPYTSYLADETVRPELASSRNFELTERRLGELLKESDGVSGVALRSSKQAFKTNSNVIIPFSSGSLSAGPATGPAPANAPGVTSYLGTDDRIVNATTVRQLGNQAIYKRGKISVTPETAGLDLIKDKEKIVTLARYSDEYFKLIEANTAEENRLLSNQEPGEELLVQLRGVNYLIQ